MTLSSKRLAIIALCCMMMIGAAGVTAQDEEVFTGSISDSSPSDTYEFELQEGDALVAVVDATSGDLDTVLNLYAPVTDRIVANNDDRGDSTLDSAIGYIAAVTGTYKLEVTRYEDGNSSGNYRLEVTIGGEDILSMLDDITRVQLSGNMQFLDTEHFRIHYTFDGADATTQRYLDAVARAAEETYDYQIGQVGWYLPPSDGAMGGNGMFDIYLSDLIGSGEDALGYTTPDSVIGDNPNSPEVETAAATSYLIVENDFQDVDGGEPIQLMRATVAHEFHHAVQFGFDVDDDQNWLYEATASWMETQTFPEDQDATGYVAYAYQYPELCFGTIDDPGAGQLQYGEWTFLQHVTDEYGDQFAVDLWRNVADHEGFDSLQAALAQYGQDTVPDALVAYRTRNFARDYELAPLFNATVWMEEIITDAGRWTYSGEGIQELGANYFGIDLPNGTYYAGLVNDDGALTLYALGVNRDTIDVIPLDRGGVIDTALYDSLYLMVFNPNYDDNLSDCTYYDYQIDIVAGKGEMSAVLHSWDAENFEPLS